MPAFQLEQFGGMLPAWDGHLLPVGQASYAKNTYLFSGTLQGWRKPKRLHTLLNATSRSVFRIPTIAQTQAGAYLAFLAQPSPGDTAIVGEQTYTFVNSLVNSFDVLIGANTAATALNFSQALTADGGANTNSGTHYGENTPANGEVKRYAADATPIPGLNAPLVLVEAVSGVDRSLVRVGANDFGAAYNNVQVAESTGNVRLSWLYATDVLASTTVTYAGGTNPTLDTSITGLSTWMEFDDPDTDVFKSPTVNDQWQRYYFTSPSEPPKYNTYDRIVNGDPAWLLGVPAPGCAPTLSVTGGGNSMQLGNMTTTSLPVTNPANSVTVVRVHTSGTTQLTQVSFNALVTATVGLPAAEFAAVLYTDNDGVPGTLLNHGAIETGVFAEHANVSVFANPTSLDTNTWYWIGVITNTAIPYLGGPIRVPTNTRTWSNTFTNGPDQTAPAATGMLDLNMWGDFVTGDVLTSRAYVYTWVTEYGEEGPPSPPTILDGWSNGTWTVGVRRPPADDTGVLRNITKLRIYRTVPGSGGTTVFFFVTELDFTTDTFIDTIDDATVALNDQMESTTWFAPPTALEGFQVMQNGMVAGFKGNEVWFCEPFHPHAWPPQFVITTDTPIVGLGVTNGALVVVTDAVPYVISGSLPSQMTPTRCGMTNPCLSRGSILSMDNAVSYTSPNGLIQITPGAVATNTTDLWMTRENWQQLTPQGNARAILLASCYYCLGSVSPDGTDVSEAQRGFTIALDQDNTSFTIWPQPGGHRLGFELLDTPTGFDIQNILTDQWSGVGLVIADGSVWWFDFADPAPELQVYTWTSKLYQQNAIRNYSAMKVAFTIPPNTPTLNSVRIENSSSDSVWASLPTDRYGYLLTYADANDTGAMDLVDAREIRKPGEVLRIVDGFKASHWQWKIVGRVKIANVQIATSVKELAQI